MTTKVYLPTEISDLIINYAGPTDKAVLEGARVTFGVLTRTHEATLRAHWEAERQEGIRKHGYCMKCHCEPADSFFLAGWCWSCEADDFYSALDGWDDDCCDALSNESADWVDSTEHQYDEVSDSLDDPLPEFRNQHDVRRVLRGRRRRTKPKRRAGRKRRVERFVGKADLANDTYFV